MDFVNMIVNWFVDYHKQSLIRKIKYLKNAKREYESMKYRVYHDSDMTILNKRLHFLENEYAKMVYADLNKFKEANSEIPLEDFNKYEEMLEDIIEIDDEKVE